MNLASRFILLSTIVLGGCAANTQSGNVHSAGAVVKESAGHGAQATDFTLKDTDGRNVRLTDYLGHDVVLVDFWATWCVPCEAELPLLEKIYEENKEHGFVVIAISMDGPETIAQVGPYVRRYNLQFPVLLDEETKVTNVYNPKRSAPLGVLIDRKGVISRVREGYSSGDENLIRADVKSLVGD